MSDIFGWEIVAVREGESCYGVLRIHGWAFEDAEPIDVAVRSYSKRSDGTLVPADTRFADWITPRDWSKARSYHYSVELDASSGGGTGPSEWTDYTISDAYGPTSTVAAIVRSAELGVLEGEFELRGSHPEGGAVDLVSPRLELPQGVKNYQNMIGQCLVEVKADQEQRRALEQAEADAEAAKLAAENEAARLQREKELELVKQQGDAELAAIRLEDAAEQARLVKLAEAEKTTTLRLRLEADLEIARALQLVAEERIKGKLAREETGQHVLGRA